MSALESRLDAAIKKFCLSKGAFHIKTHGSSFSAGLPDHIICYKGKYIGLEAKAAGGVVAPLQYAKLRKIQLSGGIGEVVYNMRPVEAIFQSIDNNEIWENTEFPKFKIG